MSKKKITSTPELEWNLLRLIDSAGLSHVLNGKYRDNMVHLIYGFHETGMIAPTACKWKSVKKHGNMNVSE